MTNFFGNISFERLVGLTGLIIASVSLGWNILNEIRKIPKAKIYAMVGKRFGPGNPQGDTNHYLVITISNIWSRPLRINGIAYECYKWWWLPFKKEYAVITPKQLPIYLKDGEEHIEDYPYEPKQFKELLDKNIRALYAYDSAGRHHKLSRWDMIKFKRNIRKLIRELKINL